MRTIDTVMYCVGPSIKEAVVKLQAVFNIIQTQLSELKLILNVDKTKVMLFSKAKKTPETTLDIVTTQGKLLEVINTLVSGLMIVSLLNFRSIICLES